MSPGGGVRGIKPIHVLEISRQTKTHENPLFGIYFALGFVLVWVVPPRGISGDWHRRSKKVSLVVGDAFSRTLKSMLLTTLAWPRLHPPLGHA